MAGLVLVAAASLAPAAAVAQPARAMQITGYDDGAACPGGCDAHVVFHPSHQATANAFDPASPRSDPRPCREGEPCRVCFGADDASCLDVRYRGSGPGPGRLDFTPAFFAEACARPPESLPAALAAHCAYLREQHARLRARTSCFADPARPGCRALAEARIRKAADDGAHAACRAEGEAAWNARHASEPARQRSVACAYEALQSEMGADGSRWSRLLDGACPAGSVVGRSGLDCCSGDAWNAAVTWPECDLYWPAP